LPDQPSAAAAPAGAARHPDRTADTPGTNARASTGSAPTPESTSAAAPADADATQASAAPPDDDAARAPRDVGVLESLGRAISAPVRDAAAPDEAAQTGARPPA
jgi:hypothetical protein